MMMMLMLFLVLIPLSLALVSSFVIHANELVFVGGSFDGFFGSQTVHKFADPFLPVHSCVAVTTIVIQGNHSQASNHALPQKAFLVRCPVFFRFFLDPSRVVVNCVLRQLPETSLAPTTTEADPGGCFFVAVVNAVVRVSSFPFLD